MQDIRAELEERIFDHRGIGDQQRGLAEIIQHQRRQADREPGKPDRQAPEMPHIGIHRFAAGHGEEGCAEDREGDVEVLVDQEVEGVERTECRQHGRCLDDAVDAERGQHDEPGQHHRSEDAADEARALLLHHEQADQDDDGDGYDRRRERGGVDLEALDGREYRDRRRDRAVAIEQRRADQADRQEMRAPGTRLGVTGMQQRQ